MRTCVRMVSWYALASRFVRKRFQTCLPLALMTALYDLVPFFSVWAMMATSALPLPRWCCGGRLRGPPAQGLGHEDGLTAPEADAVLDAGECQRHRGDDPLGAHLQALGKRVPGEIDDRSGRHQRIQ